MSQMQYTRVFTSVEQRLAEAGLCELPHQPRFRKWDNGFLKLVGPAYTSSTCSACGHVHSSEFYKKLSETIENNGQGEWHVTLENGSKRILPATYSYWIRGKGVKTANTDERLREILNGRPVPALSKSNRAALISLLKNRWLPYRPEQAQFQCIACGHRMNADLQGALNIARKHLFRIECGIRVKEEGEAVRRGHLARWENWYKEKLMTSWQ
jgi:hypothetical protein